MGTETTDLVGMKRWLAFLEGGLLPIISLTSLHFFVKYEKIEEEVLVNHKTNDVEEDMYNPMSEHPEDVYVPKTDKKNFKVEVKDIPKEEVEEHVGKYKEKIKFKGIDPDEELRKQLEESARLEQEELEKTKKLKNS